MDCKIIITKSYKNSSYRYPIRGLKNFCLNLVVESPGTQVELYKHQASSYIKLDSISFYDTDILET